MIAFRACIMGHAPVTFDILGQSWKPVSSSGQAGVLNKCLCPTTFTGLLVSLGMSTNIKVPERSCVPQSQCLSTTSCQRVDFACALPLS